MMLLPVPTVLVATGSLEVFDRPRVALAAFVWNVVWFGVFLRRVYRS